MRLGSAHRSSSPRAAAAVAAAAAAALLLPTASAISYQCDNIRVDDTAFHLKSLGGQHAVSWVHEPSVATINETFYIDICEPLKFDDDTLRRGCKQGTQSA